MVQTNWERILSVKAVSLTDQEIEDLFPMVIRCDVEDVDNIHNLKALMKLSQEMLQHKDNQVESLLLECDELKQKILESTPASSSKIKKARGNFASDSVNGEGDTARKKKNENSPMVANAPYNDEVLREKNAKVETLISELEGLEQQNMSLKEKLRTVKEEMEDATENMNEMTEELNVLRSKIVIYKEKITEREQENRALIAQIEAITGQQIDRDKIIDEFSEAIDARVTEWKGILDKKDAEIAELKESLSQSLMQSITTTKEQSKSQIVHLNQVIDQRDHTIEELQSKLSEAVVEMNESTAVIEKLKADARKMEKSSRRKEQRDLLKKVQEANEKISNLQTVMKQAEDDAEMKSKQLCEALATLKKYENGEYGLPEAITELKYMTNQLCQKDKHIEDLVNVINKMEMLNSHQEMEIAVLCEKLGIPTDQVVSVEGVIAKHKEEMREAEELKQRNKCLREENIEMKSDIRTLKYKLRKLAEKVVAPNDIIVDVDMDLVRPSKISETDYDWVAERERVAQHHMMEIDEIKDNVRIVVEENEALRKGMHEILDSIHNQDGKCTVDIQSDTLERLLEALDVRHLAGWYHPAMRLQSRLSVIQGSNTELRTQLKQIRKELQKKDEILQQIVLNKYYKKPDSVSVHEESSSEYISEMKQLQELFRNEKEEWQKEKNTLYDEKSELEDTITRLEVHLEEYERNWQILESGEDEIKKAFAERSKESAENAVQIIILNRKCRVLEELLSKESTKNYIIQKEAIARENDQRKMFADLNKSNKMLESKIATFQSNLSNSVSMFEFNGLKEKYEEMCIKYRMIVESEMGNSEGEIFKDKLEIPKQEKNEPFKEFEKPTRDQSETNMGKESTDLQSREFSERQRADHMTKLNEILQSQLVKCENDLKESSAVKSELQEQLIQLHKRLSKETQTQDQSQPDENKICELKEKIRILEIENENFGRTAEIAHEEVEMYRSLNSLKTFELDSLRHQLLDLQSVSEDKETIARLGVELTNCKVLETEANKKKNLLEQKISRLQDENKQLKRKCEEFDILMQDCQKKCQSCCRNYLEMIDFLQQQYAGSTTLTALERFDSMLKKLTSDRAMVDIKLKEVSERCESVKLQQDTLASRLKIVEQLKDILEQQIGGPNVQDIIHRFSETSQHTLSELRYKRKIAHLENELQMVNNKAMAHDATINAMEAEMVNIQRIWCKSAGEEMNVANIEIRTMAVESRSVLIQTQVENQSVATQSEHHCSCSKDKDAADEEDVLQSISHKAEPDNDSVLSLNEKLGQALKLASERSVTLMKYESQITEYQAKISALSKLNDERDSQLLLKDKTIEQMKQGSNATAIDGSDKRALQSIVNSLQKIVAQKEETIVRYQNLLKEDRNEHSKSAARLQDEIKGLQAQLANMQDQVEQRLNNSSNLPESDNKLQQRNKNIDLEEVAEKLNEKVSTLEADLNIARELGERWHRLAEERLNHMDHMRERLEEQHKNELESYRIERDKWKTETDTLRQQLSENRMQLAKGNISLVKELQERDNRIHELSIAYQQLQNELELVETTKLSQQMVVQDSKMQQMATNLCRGQVNQAQLDLAKRQLQLLTEKEKTYKNQIVDLKQQLSRRYMAVKTQEQKASQREIQLERKVRSLEEELHKTRNQLNKEHLINEAKKVKTAEELALWDKQKRWQQTAEKFKDKLKEKTKEYEKLQTNYEKLRSVISCMEREKWYLKSKLRFENGSIVGSLSARPGAPVHSDIIEEVQQECNILRDRVRELTDRLDNEDNSQLILKIEEQRRQIAALEAVTQGNTYIVDQLERLEATKDVLEKTNLKLESENLELRLELEKINLDTPRLREKVEHLEKYVELLKIEKTSDSSPRSSDKDSQDQGKKSVTELERTVFILKRVVEKLQAENKRLKIHSKKHNFSPKGVRPNSAGSSSSVHEHYERAQQRVIALETDLQLAEQRIAMLENAQKEEENSGDIGVLRQQLAHKSDLLDKVKQLLTRAAINEKALRQRVQQLEMKQTLSTIPECYVSGPSPDLQASL